MTRTASPPVACKRSWRDDRAEAKKTLALPNAADVRGQARLACPGGDEAFSGGRVLRRLAERLLVDQVMYPS